MKKIGAMALVGIGFLLFMGSVAAAPDNTVTLAPMALNSITDPPDKIANAMVVDLTGSPVGAVRKVEMDAHGKPIKVGIALLGTQQVIAVDLSNLSYDEARNVLTAGLDKNQIVRMPVVPQGRS